MSAHRSSLILRSTIVTWPQWLKRSLVLVLLVAPLGSVVSGNPNQQDPSQLRKYKTRHYELHTNLPRAEAVTYGHHMDRIFKEYSRRFRAFRFNSHKTLPLYLFRTSEQYESFLAKHDIFSRNTGGIFFVQPKITALASWTQGKSRSQTFATLQHEGFHQFAYYAIGTNLPIWVNEGLAGYFEEAIFVKNRVITGLGDARRIHRLKIALEKNLDTDFQTMLNLTGHEWQQIVSDNPQQGSLLYDQAWSMVHYMVTGNKQRTNAFVHYLQLLSRGYRSNRAFREAFGPDIITFRRGWESFTLKMEPDRVTSAVARLEFLGYGLSLLHQRGEKPPSSIQELRKQLQKHQFQLQMPIPGDAIEYSAMDESNYYFERKNGTRGKFVIYRSVDPTLPPRITAEGLSPVPTLMWSRDEEGELIVDIEYR